MAKKLYVIGNICPECASDFGHSMEDKGYFCIGDSCKYSYGNKSGLCFAYFSGDEWMTRTLSVLKRKVPRNDAKGNTNTFDKRRAIMLKMLPSEYAFQCEKRELRIDDPFFRAYVPFIEPEEVKSLCGFNG